MAATLSPPRLLPSGDSAITVEFSRNIDDAANQRVLALDRTLARETIAGVTETVPTYRSLLVHYDPVQIDFDALGEKLVALAQLPVPPATKTRRWRIPVVYGGEHGIDLEDVAKTLNTTPDDIVARHVAGDYRVAMIGFTPGWSYLSGLRGFAADAAAAKSAAADAGRHDLDRRRADRRAMPGRSERLASAGTDRGANLSAASRSDLPAGTRRPRDVFGRRCQNLRGAGSRRGSRRDRRRVDGVMSKLVISAIGPAKLGAGRRPPRRPALWPDAERRDGPAGARRPRIRPGRKRAVRRRDRNRPVRRGVHGARRRGSRRARGRVAQRRHRRARRCRRYIDDAGGWRDPDAGLCARRFVQLPRDRRRDCGRADVRQPRGECARRARQPVSAPAAGRRRIADGSRQRRGRAPDRSSRPVRTGRSAW